MLIQPEISDTDLNKEALSDSDETVENTEEGEELATASDEDDYLNIDDEDDDMPYDRVKSKKKNSRKVRRFNKKKTIKVIAITASKVNSSSAALNKVGAAQNNNAVAQNAIADKLEDVEGVEW